MSNFQPQSEDLGTQTGAAASKLVEFIEEQFAHLNLNESVASLLALAAVIGCMVVLGILAYFITRKILNTSLGFVAKRSRTKWDDILIESRAFARLSYIAPALVVYFFASAYPSWEAPVQHIALAYMILVGALVFSALLGAVDHIYRTLDISRNRPIKGFIEIFRLLLYVVTGVLILATLMNRSPWGILSGIGAITAVLLIVFKDTLLGLVASFQITANDMVREGDWIEMPKFGADGDVIDVTLHTVKVRNWDKTITTIPAYALVSDSFKNWRGMEESGGRRIKRSVYIDMNSIAFCTDEMLARFEKIQLISEYVREKRQEVAAFNEETGADVTVLSNGRRLTNVGTLRAYIVAYLKSREDIRQDMTFLVRQLQPTEHGLPIEIYIFSKIQAWVRYEAIQADIFDHILAVVPEFGLRVFQNPSGSDFATLAG